MGQYLKGSKIGTCESMYYMRLEEAKERAKSGEKDDDGIKFSDYLKDNTTRWRFPFPDEDGADSQVLVGKAWDKGFEIPAGIIEDIDHVDICASNSFKDGGHNVNILFPCPYSQDFKDMRVETSTGGAGEQFLSVKFQAIRDGKEKTIFECARCGSQFRLDDKDVEKLKKYALEYFEPYNRKGKNDSYGGNQALYDYAEEIIKRIK